MSMAEEARARGKLPNGAVKSRELYKRWVVMRRRCYDDKFIVYSYYGGRGIRVCDEWKTDFLMFQKWALSHGWDPSLTLDRKDPKGDYSPKNCRWITLAEQQRNRSEWCIYVKVHGKRVTVGELADKHGVPRSLAYMRIRKLGWRPDRAATVASVNNRKEYTVDGESRTVYAWAKMLGVSRSWMYVQIEQGKLPEDLIRGLIERKTNGV